jgi:hypothetical protein
MADGSRELLEAWNDFRQRAGAYRELDAKPVLVLARVGGRGGVSEGDVEIQARTATLSEVRGGEVMRLVTDSRQQHALADLSLEA